LAKSLLNKLAFDYYASGAHDEITLKRNCEAYQELSLKYKVLVDVSKRDLSSALLGQRVSMPICVAPMAMQRLAHPDGELAMTRAAGNAGTIMILSTLSTHSIEEVAANATGPIWFQLYIYKDRGITRSLVQRAQDAGCKALVLTVDSPQLGRRERDVRNRFRLPDGLELKNLLPFGHQDLPAELADSGLAAYIHSLYDASLSWKDLDWLMSLSKLPLVIKGIARADDAKRAIERGASAIVVSNHGGRQLDTAIATIEALPEIAEAVGISAEIYVDGGIRRGTDIVKAIALGAKAVLIGRPALWGLAAGGEQGALRVLQILKEELDLAMALCGCPTISDITPDLVARK